MARIVVLGPGISGIAQIYELSQELGKWVHLAKIAYEKYFLHKVRAARTEPCYEKMALKMVGANRLKKSI